MSTLFSDRVLRVQGDFHLFKVSLCGTQSYTFHLKMI